MKILNFLLIILLGHTAAVIELADWLNTHCTGLPTSTKDLVDGACQALSGESYTVTCDVKGSIVTLSTWPSLSCVGSSPTTVELVSGACNTAGSSSLSYTCPASNPPASNPTEQPGSLTTAELVIIILVCVGVVIVVAFILGRKFNIFSNCKARLEGSRKRLLDNQPSAPPAVHGPQPSID